MDTTGESGRMGERRGPVSTLKHGMIGKEKSKDGFFFPLKALRYDREGGNRETEGEREKG